MKSRNPEVRARALESMREYYHKTKRPFECECGRVIEAGRRDKHLKTEIHALLMHPMTMVAGPSREDFDSFWRKGTHALPHCPDR